MDIGYSPKQQKALNTFRSGLNCAQSVLMAFQEDLDFDSKSAMALAAGFGGGMGRLQLTCGALTGAFMTIGYHCSKKYDQVETIKEHSRKMIQKVHNEFTALHNFSDCSSLLNLDLNKPEDRKRMKEENLEESVCEKCILTTVAILEEEFINE
jgi:C_GCAxxG_C_C family probable redox protein